ncbi:helix-turn-helix domain-containing protein [Aquipuribacter sp. SD81]|uniref:helix-turn-helix domain-containing protein n=1 Tax=Aquipuribacter sp. SD81 TaxID=3127703 RepID=UPI003017BD3F
MRPAAPAVTAAPVRTTPPLRVLLGHVLRRHRLAQRRTLADVARAAQVSTQYLSEVERGRKEASSEVLAALCRALLLDLTDLLAEVRDDVLELRSTGAGTRVVGLSSRLERGPVRSVPEVRAAA